MNDLYTYQMIKSDSDRALADHRASQRKADPNCPKCDGLGVYPAQDGPDDFEEVECACVRRV